MKIAADVLVVGGGPAGLAAAIAARDKGFHVIVADGDKPPISKACGEGLLPEAVEGLWKLGVTFGPADGQVLRGIRFQDHGAAVGAEFRGMPGLGVRREVLHQRLLERAAERGVALLWNAPVTGLCSSGAIVAGNRIMARWVIGADGIRSRVRRWAGLGEARLSSSRFAWRQHLSARPWSDFIEIHWDGDTQAYVTPVGAEEICVVLISDRPQMRMGAALQRFPELAERFASAPRTSMERGAVTRMGKFRRVTQGRVALVGDAAGTVDAITGQGLSLAFRQALVLADAMEAGDLAQYEQQHRRFARRPWMMASLLLQLGRHGKIRRRALRTLQAAPHLFEPMLAFHTAETRALELAAAGAQFGWRFLTA